MNPRFFIWTFLGIAGVLLSHPMGNFSVSHYSLLELTARGVEVEYVLDLAELPTYDLLRKWNLDKDSPRADLEKKAAEQAREWAANLKIAANGRPVTAKFRSAGLALSDGAGSLPVMRITSRLHLDASPGNLTYDDPNFEGRAGWKEIVVRAGRGAIVEKASQGDVRSIGHPKHL